MSINYQLAIIATVFFVVGLLVGWAYPKTTHNPPFQVEDSANVCASPENPLKTQIANAQAVLQGNANLDCITRGLGLALKIPSSGSCTVRIRPNTNCEANAGSEYYCTQHFTCSENSL